jgi:hypothetical protein
MVACVAVAVESPCSEAIGGLTLAWENAMPVSITAADYAAVEDEKPFTSEQRVYAFLSKRRKEAEVMRLVAAAQAGLEFSIIVGNVMPLMPRLKQLSRPSREQSVVARRGRAAASQKEPGPGWSVMPEPNLAAAEAARKGPALAITSAFAAAAREYHERTEDLTKATEKLTEAAGAFSVAFAATKFSEKELLHWKQPLQAATAFVVFAARQEGYSPVGSADLSCILILSGDRDLEDIVDGSEQVRRLKARGQTLRRAEEHLVPSLDRLLPGQKAASGQRRT